MQWLTANPIPYMDVIVQCIKLLIHLLVEIELTYIGLGNVDQQ